MSIRQSRAERAEANRTAVITAARAEFEQHGYHRSSLDAISEAAGFSKGVVYSQFGSKDELLLAVLEASISSRQDELKRVFDQFNGPEDLPQLLTFSFEQGTATAAWQAALLEFRLHAWRDPDLNAKYAALHERSLTNVQGFIRQLYRRGGVDPPDDPRRMAAASMACGLGFLVELMVQPELSMSELVSAIGFRGDAAPSEHGQGSR